MTEDESRDPTPTEPAPTEPAGARTQPVTVPDPARSGPSGTQGVAPTQPVSDEVEPTADVGDTVGPYRLLEVLGEGGFGRVFLAEQTHPVRRQVALKIIKLGMDTREVVARFEAERQAVALMDHPNIARVYGAGATPHGRPYFVMELVRGVPIDRYCDDKRLSTRRRLALFLAVCRAVQHAHNKGVIHRDLKPGNILVSDVDGDATPKVIDFGIAKATASALTDKTVHTKHGQFVGTPQYMSPEQAEMSGLDVDTRTDVYSLGAVLYQLLTGAPPFDSEAVRAAGPSGVAELLRDVDPPPPSQRVRTATSQPGGRDGESRGDRVARVRNTEARALVRELHRDLDWVVMKALEKDRTRRYETANALAEELVRYLADEPVVARPASTIYRLGRFARRNRLGVSLGALLLLSLVVGAAAALHGWVRARDAEALAVAEALAAREARDRAEDAEAIARQSREVAEQRLQEAEAARGSASRARDQAEREAERARSVTAFLVDTLGMADPDVALGSDVSMRSILDGAATKVVSAFPDQPDAEATVRTVIGRAYHNLGESDRAEPHLRRALELLDLLGAPPDRIDEALWPLTHVALQQERPDRYDLGRRLWRLMPERIAARHPALAEAMEGSIAALYEQDLDAFGETLQTIPGMAEASLATEDPAWPIVADFLAFNTRIARDAGRPDLAEQAGREALRLRRRMLPPNHPRIAQLLAVVVALLVDDDRDVEAEALVRESLDIQREVLGESHPATLLSWQLLAGSLLGQGRYAEVEETLTLVLDALVERHGDDTTPQLGARRLAAELQDRWHGGDAAVAARRELRLALARADRPPGDDELEVAFGADEPRVSESLGRIALIVDDEVIDDLRREDDLNAELDVLLPLLRDRLRPEEALAAVVARRLSDVAADRYVELDAATRRRLAGQAAIIGRAWEDAAPIIVAEALFVLALHGSVGPDSEAVARDATALGRRVWGENDWRTAMTRSRIGVLLGEQGRYVDGSAALEAALAIARGQRGEHSLEATRLRADLVALYAAWGRPDRASSHIVELVAVQGYVDWRWGLPLLRVACAPVASALLELERVVAADPLSVAPALAELVAARRAHLPDEAPLGLLYADRVLALADGGLPSVAAWHAALADGAEISARLLGEDHLRTFVLRIWQIVAANDGGDWEAAEALALELLLRFERRWPAGHTLMATTESLLAEALMRQGRYAEAETTLRRALATLLRHLQPGQLDATRAVRIAADLAAEGRLVDFAELVLEQALKDVLDECNDPTALASWAWAVLRRPELDGRLHPLARQLAERAVELRPNDATAQGVLGVAWFRVGRYDDALQRFADSGRRTGQLDPRFLAFAAMAFAGAGDDASAGRLLDELRATLTVPEAARVRDYRRFLAEAERKVVGGG